MKFNVLISCGQMQRVLEVFRYEFEERNMELIVPEMSGQQLSEDELLQLMPMIDGVIAGDDPFNAAVLEASTKLKILSKWGVGTDAIDFDVANRLGIIVTNTPGMFNDEVADVAAGYVVMLARGLHLIDAAVRSGTWYKPVGETLRGRTATIIGMGGIGRAIAARCSAFGMEIVGVDTSTDVQTACRALGIDMLELNDALPVADYLILAAPMSLDNRHLIGPKEIALLPRGSKVINIARGQLIDEPALFDGLRRGRIGGAALDVFEEEPLPIESPLNTQGNLILGSHNGSNTAEAVLRTSRLAVDNIFKHLGT